MLRPGLAVALLLSTAGSISSQAPQESPERPIVTTVNVVLAPVTVLDRHGDYVSGLEPANFRLFDNTKEQNIQVDVAFQPISMVIAISYGPTVWVKVCVGPTCPPWASARDGSSASPSSRATSVLG